MDKENPYVDLVQLVPGEKEVPSTFNLSEPVAISLDLVTDALRIKKKDIVNRLLEIGLENLVQTIYDTRPDLAQDDPSPEDPEGKSWSILKPSAIREVGVRFGKPVGYDEYIKYNGSKES